ncbi:BpmI endonuclease-methyltransferase fusion protein type IIG [Candidatus Burkholderia verschuerenii]|uniref:BpmI endonuclease-methyltransferase fusion protein type IIG n=2 Tax=Candidatus Burkholderia verschuerenii TaxID=242163 RepID=A0A0L0MF21_9BURK|nr:BpmI endonuclease-methyltransferase fusion protein type IIG [Candidatus Burkholderia verschuerenii]
MPAFLYVEDEAYVMLSVNVIRTRRIDMRYLSVILNSSVVRYWLRHRGNMHGSNFQIDAAPLQQIPIASATQKQRDVIASLQEQCREATPLIEACVIECYFGARDVSFIDAAAKHLDDPQSLDTPSSDIVQRLTRLVEHGPDWSALVRGDC